MKFIDYILSISLSDWGSWASLYGLLISFITLIVVFRIKKKFLFRSSIDSHIKKINDISSEVSALLGSYSDNQKAIDEFFALANVELRAMQKGSSADLLGDIKRARKLIGRYDSRFFWRAKKDENAARQIKTSLSVVAAELGHHRKSLLIGN